VHSFPFVGLSIAFAILGTVAHAAVLTWARQVWPGRFVSRWWLAACFALSALAPVARKVTLATRHPLAESVSAASLFELMFVFAIALPLLALAVFRRRPRGNAPREEAPDVLAEGTEQEPSRRDALQTIGGAAVMGTAGLALGWGMTRGRHDYEIRELVVKIPGLPKALDGYTIAQVSDVHSGLFTGPRELAEGLGRVRDVKPDMVVATGDLVDFDKRDAPPLARALADLAPRDGVFGILGNHDYYAGADEVRAAMTRAGITMLVNDARIVRPNDGGGFALLGVDDEWSKKYGAQGPDLARAAASLPKELPRILLAHQPATFRKTAGQVALQLSGHTHGGQIRPADMLFRWVAGRYERNGSVLYVNRGFGVAGPPVRLGVPPEITKVVLVAG
jgi:predicted MPP superfamily phosphohydrolase